MDDDIASWVAEEANRDAGYRRPASAGTTPRRSARRCSCDARANPVRDRADLDPRRLRRSPLSFHSSSSSLVRS
jgi:hypothetical protein